MSPRPTGLVPWDIQRTDVGQDTYILRTERGKGRRIHKTRLLTLGDICESFKPTRKSANFCLENPLVPNQDASQIGTRCNAKQRRATEIRRNASGTLLEIQRKSAIFQRNASGNAQRVLGAFNKDASTMCFAVAQQVLTDGYTKGGLWCGLWLELWLSKSRCGLYGRRIIAEFSDWNAGVCHRVLDTGVKGCAEELFSNRC